MKGITPMVFVAIIVIFITLLGAGIIPLGTITGATYGIQATCDEEKCCGSRFLQCQDLGTGLEFQPSGGLPEGFFNDMDVQYWVISGCGAQYEDPQIYERNLYNKVCQVNQYGGTDCQDILVGVERTNVFLIRVDSFGAVVPDHDTVNACVYFGAETSTDTYDVPVGSDTGSQDYTAPQGQSQWRIPVLSDLIDLITNFINGLIQ